MVTYLNVRMILCIYIYMLKSTFWIVQVIVLVTSLKRGQTKFLQLARGSKHTKEKMRQCFTYWIHSLKVKLVQILWHFMQRWFFFLLHHSLFCTNYRFPSSSMEQVWTLSVHFHIFTYSSPFHVFFLFPKIPTFSWGGDCEYIYIWMTRIPNSSI